MARDTAEDQLNERAQHLLKVLVESYIREGQPVGSRTLSRDSGLNLSAATVRNVMADLEEYGFVTSPHTSAGRVPTDKGYRFFVDTLLRRRQEGAADDVIDELRRRLDDEHDRDDSDESEPTACRLATSELGVGHVVRQPVPRHDASPLGRRASSTNAAPRISATSASPIVVDDAPVTGSVGPCAVVVVGISHGAR